jgi:hydrogenase maturation protein HypF
MPAACSIHVRGVVQGVGFRPFVYRLAQENALAGWVLNEGEGVEIHLEGAPERLRKFVAGLNSKAPPAATIAAIDVEPVPPAGLTAFSIRESVGARRPSARISPDLPVCADCVRELLDPHDARYGYPYINCTNCGPRYSIVRSLPYDRAATTMAAWPMDSACAAQYENPADRRFHAQPVACEACGPRYTLRGDAAVPRDPQPVRGAAALLREGKIVAVKGVGGYHLVCDARNSAAVACLRERKFRKEKPFALMARDLETARRVATISAASEALLTSAARPIVIVPSVATLAGIAPDNDETGLMLAYAPVHHLLFAAGAPDLLVVTSGNRSSEPISYEDADAVRRLSGIADAVLSGERPIARRVEDSVVRAGAHGTVMLRRSRGYAPAAVASIPALRPMLALGADLKNTVTLVVEGQAFVSQHIGDLSHYEAFRAFASTIDDLLTMYGVPRDDLIVVCDAHPGYRSTAHAAKIGSCDVRAVQHHRAHIASVIAERGAWDHRVLGVALDGTGYGDDGTIWGGEFFTGSVADGFARVGHLRGAVLIGGDAAAEHPVQAAAGFLGQVGSLPPLDAAPFHFPRRYRDARQLLHAGTRLFATTSAGRLFDSAAALLGFTRAITFEGQAAICIEQLARKSAGADPYRFPFARGELDFRPLLASVAADRAAGRDVCDVARAFHAGVAHGLCGAIVTLCAEHGVDTVVASGGTFQNGLLQDDLSALLAERRLQLWLNHAVPSNDGGISLGQAALAAFGADAGGWTHA